MSSMGDFNAIGKALSPTVALPSPFAVINPIRTNLRYQRKYMWEVIMPSMGYVPGILLSPLIQGVRFGDYDITNSDTTKFGAFEAKYPGFLGITDVTITFLKAVPDIATTYLTAWRKKVVSPTSVYGVKSDYARTIYVLFLDVSGIPINWYKLTGAFPKTMPSYDLDYVGEEVVQMPVVFSVDAIQTLY